MQAIPIAGGSEAPAALAQAHQALQEGHVVCIFAEGPLAVQAIYCPLKEGLRGLLRGWRCRSSPCIWIGSGGVFLVSRADVSFGNGPNSCRIPVTVSFAAPLPATATAPQVQQVVMELGSAAMAYRPKTTTPLPQRNQA